jgi:hypothetical protein
MLLNYWDGKDLEELERPFFPLLIYHFTRPKSQSTLHFFSIHRTREKLLYSYHKPRRGYRIASSRGTTPDLQRTYQAPEKLFQATL